MKIKQWIGLLILIVGIVFIIFSVYQKSRVADAKGKVSMGKSLLPKNPVSSAFGSIMDEKTSQYDAPLMWCMIGGIALVVIGGGVMIFGRRK